MFHNFTLQVPELQSQALNQQLALDDQKRRDQELQYEKSRQEQDALMAKQRLEAQLNARGIEAVNTALAGKRTWQTVSENKPFEATFIEIQNRTTVVMRTRQGYTMKVELSKLVIEDIHAAVKADLARVKAIAAARAEAANPQKTILPQPVPGRPNSAMEKAPN